MKKIIKNLIKITLLIILTLETLQNPNIIIKTTLKAFKIWKENIFPSLFIFFIIADLLINYGIIEILEEISKPITNKLFKLKGTSSFVIIMSMISGFPSSAKYIKELYEKKLIDEYESTKILMFTHFSNPLFILGTISISFLHNKKTGFLILISHYIGNLIIGLIVRNYHPSKENTKINLIKKIKNIEAKQPFVKQLTNSIKNTINSLLIILGTITFFLIITELLKENLNINNNIQIILNGIIEMTQGLEKLSSSNLPLKIKCILTSIIISFGGISVHMQINSIIQDTKIKYKPYLLARILHASISGAITYLIYNFII